MSKSAEFLKALALRRSYYTLSATSPIPDSKIQSIIKEVLKTVPSAFNTQSVRLILVLNDQHRALWQTTADIMKAKIGEERYNKGTSQKMDLFKNAYGTVLFYDDPTDVAVMKEKFPTYKDQFDPWSEHTSGMHQLAVWTALELEGFGANLQHYNPVIDEKLAEMFDAPQKWSLKGQLVFGGIEGDTPDAKPKKSLDDTFKVFGAKED